MNNKKFRCSAALAGVCAVGASAQAWHFETRFIERVGNLNVVLTDNTIEASSGAVRDIRIQMGVFDDADGEAPAGGLLGWVNGGLTVGGPVGNSDERRNPGRLAPFNANNNPNANGSPPLPGGDPFTALTQIDAALNLLVMAWTCGPDGQPLPQPAPTIRGRNTFVSVYAFSVDTHPASFSYTVVANGNQYAANSWVQAPTTIPPDCSDPDNPVPGSADYFPLAAPPRSFAATLTVLVPAPSTGVLGLGGVLLAARARRRR